MKTKIFLLALILCFLTGCSNIKYTLKVNHNYNYEEISFDYGKTNSEMVKSQIDENINSYDVNLDDISYTVTNNTAVINNKFKYLSQLKDNLFIKELYENVVVETNGNITNVSLSGINNSSFECGEFDESCDMFFDEIEFILKSEYEIVDSNADLIDAKTNTYTWKIGPNSGNVKFSVSDNILWRILILNFISENVDKTIMAFIITVIIAFIAFFAIRFYARYKSNNR